LLLSIAVTSHEQCSRQETQEDATIEQCQDRHHKDRTPMHGYEATREAASTAFAKSWRWE
jgi:hypothetical protein